MTDSGRRLTPYQRIVRNAEKGKGVHLTAEEVEVMALDDAIRQLALNDDDAYALAPIPEAT